VYWGVTPRTFKSKVHPGVPIRQFRVVIRLSMALVWERTGWFGYHGGAAGIHHDCGLDNCKREESFEAELRDAETIG